MGVKAGDRVAGRVPGGTGHGWGTRGVGDGAGLWEEEERALRSPHFGPGELRFGPGELLPWFGCKVDQ